MTRKDSEKDSERPHYYSQFWLDVAAGRRIIGTPKPSDESEFGESEPPEPIAPRKAAGRAHEDGMRAQSDGRGETIVHPVAEPIVAPSDEIFPEEELEEEELPPEEADELDLPYVEDVDIPDMDLGLADEEEEEEFLEDEEEEEEDLGWGGRGRKKPKPSRPVKPPKKPRREPRRGY
jgi:hypothetical protein